MAGTNYYANVQAKNIALQQPYLDKGQSYTGNLTTAFPGSPIHSGELTVENQKELFQQLVLDGEVLNGNGLTSFNRDYSKNETLDITGIDIEGLNLPSPYMPNPSSPGEGSFDADDKPNFDGKIKDAKTVNAQFGSGNNSLYNPAISSQKLGDLKLGFYLPGQSGGNWCIPQMDII